MNKEEILRMNDLEGSHWWYQTLHNRVVKSLKQNNIPKEAKILDLGCGTGGLLQILLAHGYNQLEGIDLSQEAVQICQAKNLKVLQGSLQSFESFTSHEAYDVVICNDVLYFLDRYEQETLFKKIGTLLNPGGLMITNNPALGCFSGPHDQTVGISKRMHHKELELLILKAPLRINKQIYWPFLLSPIIYFIRLKQRVLISKTQKQIGKSDLYPLPFLINQILILINKVEISLSLNMGFGSSLFTIIKKI